LREKTGRTGSLQKQHEHERGASAQHARRAAQIVVKTWAYFLLILLMYGSSNRVVASEQKRVELPNDLKHWTSPDTTPIYFASNGLNAIIVLESSGKLSESGASRPRNRTLLLLRKVQGIYVEAARTDKVIACSTCGQDGMDPFIPEGVNLKYNELKIEQDYTPEPSMAIYDIAYDTKASQWVMKSALNADVFQNFSERPLSKITHKLNLPARLPLVEFNPEWRPREPSIAVTIDESGVFSFLSDDTKDGLDREVVSNCANKLSCHEVARQTNGCVSLVKDDKRSFFAGTAENMHEAPENEAKQKAMSKCDAKLGSICREIRTDCTSRFLNP
jgi:hypothetical protein